MPSRPSREEVLATWRATTRAFGSTEDPDLGWFPIPSGRVYVAGLNDDEGPVAFPPALWVETTVASVDGYRELLRELGALASMSSWCERHYSYMASRILITGEAAGAHEVRLALAASVIQRVESERVTRILRGEHDEAGHEELWAELKEAAAHGGSAFSFTQDIERARGVWRDAGCEVERRGEMLTILPGPWAPSAIIALLDEHPVWGPGMSVRLLFPSRPADPELAVTQLADLTLEELDPEDHQPPYADLLGAWCVSPEGTPAFVTFVPEPVLLPGILVRLVDGAIERARWAYRRR